MNKTTPDSQSPTHVRTGLTLDATAKWYYAIICCYTAFLCTTISRSTVVTGDPAFYVGLAESMAHGLGYFFNGAPHTKFPPGFPIVIAPLVAVVGTDIPSIQLYVAVVAGLAVGVVACYGRVRGDIQVLAIVGVLVFSGAFYLLATGEIRSEFLYIGLSFGSLILLEQSAGEYRDTTYMRLLAMAVLTLGAVSTRAIGVVLPAALVMTMAHVALRRVRHGVRVSRSLVTLLAVGAIVGVVYFLGWSWWIALHGSSSSYFHAVLQKNPNIPDLGRAQLGDVVIRVFRGIRIQGTHLAELMLNVPWLKPLWLSPFLVVIAGATIVGWLHELRRPNPAAAWYAFFYLAVIVLWPYDEGTRFLIPVLPLLALFAFRGVRSVLDWSARHPYRFVRYLAGLCAFGTLGAIAESGLSGDMSRQNLGMVCLWVLCALVYTAHYAVGWHRSHPALLPRALAATYGCSFAVLGVAAMVVNARANIASTRPSPGKEIQGAIPWILQNTGPSDRVMADHYSGIHFHTGRRTLQLPRTGDPDLLREVLTSTRPEFILISDPGEHPYFLPTGPDRLAILQRLFPDAIDLVFHYDHGSIYRFEPGTCCGSNGRRGDTHPTKARNTEDTGVIGRR